MKYLKYVTSLIVLTGLYLNSCVDIYELDKYKHPDWLAGKLYTQISEVENLSTFKECLELTGYDTLLDISGSFTVFAPSDQAFAQFFSNNPQYGGKVSNIPFEELVRIVKYHIIQDAWSKVQLQKLDLEGWIDPGDPDSKPKAYKRQTLLREPNAKYWVDYSTEQASIVDSTKTDDYRIVYTRSRKYVPIFFQEFFSIYDLSSSDYEFYFDRTFEPDNIYYAGAKVGEEEIFAENGFIYIIDKVNTPLLNAEQMLKKEYPGESYKTFLELIYLFPQFEFNREETNNQTAAREGRLYDSLYNMSFPDLPFDIHEELTGPNISFSNYTYVFHNALYVPTDNAFQKFLDDVVTEKSGYPHWPNFKSVPNNIKQIIINTHFAHKPVYETDIIEGFRNAGQQIIHLDPSTIIRKEFGSNCTFLGLNETITPRAFSSVTGPVYLRPGYSSFMYAMQLAKVLSALTREEEYSFFTISDATFQEDSSLLLVWDDIDLNRYHFMSFNRSEERMNRQQTNELAKRILNQVGTSTPTGIADKEFIETMGGNFIIWNQPDNTVQGAKPNVFGFKGDSTITLNPVLLEEPTDNGLTYTVTGWFRHSSTDMYGALSGYPYFRDLLEKAGLYNPKLYAFTFLTSGEYYTVFIPSEESLNNYGADTLATDQLASLLKYHFVRGERIFTDGKKPWKNYETLRLDESSSTISTYYSTLNIRPSPDMIEILDDDGDPYVTIHEEAGTTNILVATDTDKKSGSDTDFITTAVIHEIDTVLIKQ